MKLIVLGDIHGRTVWKDILRDEEWDQVVFLGDYVSTHDNIDEDQQIENLEYILEFKKANQTNVILLRGNHDMQHLGYAWVECSGLFRGVLRKMSQNEMKEEFLRYTQWIYRIDDLLFSHAGVSTTWLKNIGLDDVDKINDLPPSEKFGFWPEHYSDWSGESVTQPCTWIRPSSLLQDRLGGYIQFVGHTPVRQTCYYMKPIFLCDGLGNDCWVNLDIKSNKYTVKRYDYTRRVVDVSCGELR